MGIEEVAMREEVVARRDRDREKVARREIEEVAEREGWRWQRGRDRGRELLVQTLGKLTSSLLSASHQVMPHTSSINKSQADSLIQVVGSLTIISIPCWSGWS